MLSLRRARVRAPGAAEDRGFALITVIGWGTAFTLLISVVAGYALNSISKSRRAQDYSAAVTAAQSGVDLVVALVAAGQNPTSTPGWKVVPGSTLTKADGTVVRCVDETDETLNRNCPQYRYQVTDNPDGTKTVLAAGRTNRRQDNGSVEVVRGVRATLTKAAPTDYLYYSEVEAADPADGFAYPFGAPANCYKRTWPAADARGDNCQEPMWREGDTTDGSRLHTNDVFQSTGRPEFGSQITTAYDQCAPSVADPVCFLSTGTGPDFQRGEAQYSTGLDLTVTDSQMEAMEALAARSGCRYVGPTRISFQGKQMEVWSPQTPATPVCGGGGADLHGEITIKLPVVGSILPITVPVKLGDLTVLATQLGVDVHALIGNNLDAITGLLGVSKTVDIPTDGPIYVAEATAAPSPLYCLLGSALGLTGSLDTNVTQNDCQAGDLFVDGDFHGRTSIGSDGSMLILSDLKYAKANGNSDGDVEARQGTSRLGLVAKGPVEVYSPLQCVLALSSCLSLPGLLDTVGNPLSLLNKDIEIDAAIMSIAHRFGTQLPLLQLSASAELLELVSLNVASPPTLTLYGSVAQRYRGVIGADLLSVDLSIPGAIDLASADVDLGYRTNLEYDSDLRDDPPPFYPTTEASGYRPSTFAELPLDKLPAAWRAG